MLVKSIIIDIADDWGRTTGMGIRSVDFYNGGSKITNLNSTDFSAYATSSLGNGWYPFQSFDTSLSKTGSSLWTSWNTSSITNQRLICVFNEDTEIDGITINNYHSNGGVTDSGVKNIKIYASTDEITDTTYDATISNSILIFDDQVDAHVSSDIVDNQVLDLTFPAVETNTLDVEIQSFAAIIEGQLADRSATISASCPIAACAFAAINSTISLIADIPSFSAQMEKISSQSIVETHFDFVFPGYVPPAAQTEGGLIFIEVDFDFEQISGEISLNTPSIDCQMFDIELITKTGGISI